MNILARLLLILFLFSSSLEAAPFRLKDRFVKTQPGDFIITEQDKTYSLLSTRSVTPETLVLEEISVPSSLVDTKTLSWQQWVKAKCPGHTSWTLYEIDLNSGKLIECFSVSQKGWLFLGESQQFLTKLLMLPLAPVKSSERHKIGPAPAAGEPDQRAPWNPPLIISGKKIPKPQFDVWKGTWPSDGSLLADCFVEFFFNKQNPSFPFPHWIEVHSTHYNFKLRVVDSGTQLISSFQGPVPHRVPRFAGATQKEEEFWKIPLICPAYHDQIILHAVDLSADHRRLIPISYHPSKPQGELRLLEIPRSTLLKHLTPNHRYQWSITSQKEAHTTVESDEIFTWTP